MTMKPKNSFIVCFFKKKKSNEKNKKKHNNENNKKNIFLVVFGQAIKGCVFLIWFHFDFNVFFVSCVFWCFLFLIFFWQDERYFYLNCELISYQIKKKEEQS